MRVRTLAQPKERNRTTTWDGTACAAHMSEEVGPRNALETVHYVTLFVSIQTDGAAHGIARLTMSPCEALALAEQLRKAALTGGPLRLLEAEES